MQQLRGRRVEEHLHQWAKFRTKPTKITGTFATCHVFGFWLRLTVENENKYLVWFELKSDHTTNARGSTNQRRRPDPSSSYARQLAELEAGSSRLARYLSLETIFRSMAGNQDDSDGDESMAAAIIA